jgi:hypothetical protein
MIGFGATSPLTPVAARDRNPPHPEVRCGDRERTDRADSRVKVRGPIAVSRMASVGVLSTSLLL